jgi:hypothetical protein
MAHARWVSRQNQGVWPEVDTTREQLTTTPTDPTTTVGIRVRPTLQVMSTPLDRAQIRTGTIQLTKAPVIPQPTNHQQTHTPHQRTPTRQRRTMPTKSII